MNQLFFHELRDNLQSGKFALAVVVMLIAFLISLGMMNQEYQGRLENYNASLALSGKDLFYNKIIYWEFSNGGFNSSDTLTFPMGKVRKPEPMLYFARGMDKMMRQSVEFFSTFPIIDVTVRPEQEANLFKTLFTAPDLLFMVQVLVSLLAMLFSYNLICEEKERGTLKLLLIAGHSRTVVFAGKFLGGLVSIWLAFSVCFLVYLTSLTFVTPFSLAGEIPMRILLIFLTSLLHITVFFCLGALISTITNKSAPALIVSLFFWLLVVFILPGLASLVAQQFVPVESEQKISRMKLEKAQEMEEDYAASHPDDNTSGSTAGYGQRSDAIRQQISDALQQIQDEHIRKKYLQAVLTASLARISPVGSTTYLYTALSGNGIEDVMLYQRDLQTIRSGWDQQVTQMLTGENALDDFTAGGWNVSENTIRRFVELMDYGRNIKFNNLTLGETLASTWLDFVLLAVFSLVALAVAFIRFLVYDPR